MRRRTAITITTILLAVVVVALTSCGILSGIRRDWGGMGLCFFLAVDSAWCLTIVLLNYKIESRFIQLAGHFVGKYESDQFVRKFVPTSVIILTLTFRGGIVLLLILACKRNWGLILGVLLLLFLIENAVSAAVTIWLKVKTCCKRLEEIVSRDNEGVCV